MQAMIIQQIWALADPIATEEGLEIVDIELRREGHGTTLRVFLDRLGGGGVDLDHLARFSRQVGDVLDVHDFVAGAYTLETSSPGLNRRLRVPEHFRRYIGERVRVRLAQPIDGRRTFLAPLAAVEQNGIVLAVDGQAQFIPFTAIAQANYEYDIAAESGHRRGGARRQHATGTQPRD